MYSHCARKWIGAVVAVIFSAGLANAAEWRVVQASGDVWVGSSEAQQVALKRATVVPNGGIIVTGSNGRVALSRGADMMVIGPNSVIAVPADRNGQTTVLQQSGVAAFTVDHQKRPHFTVETPYLAAVVKGTRFTVQVSSTGADLIVDRGLVGVTGLATGDSIDVAPGQYAIVSGSAKQLSAGGLGILGKVGKGKPSTPLFAPLSPGRLWDLAAGRLDGVAHGLATATGNGKGNRLALGQTGDRGNDSGNSDNSASQGDNGKAGDNGNSNNGNGGGNGNANSGNGNASGNGNNGNGGGNGNGNAGGNGNNGNAGGNGNNGHGH